jgi:hypothetical protein
MIEIPIVDAVFKVIDKLIPDKEAAAKMKLDTLQLQQAGEFREMDADLQMAQGQIDINKAEASSNDNFRAGWRPFVGWVCGFGFATQFVLGPWGTWIAALYGNPVAFPEMDMATMMPLLLGMLGLGTLRSWDKKDKKGAV